MLPRLPVTMVAAALAAPLAPIVPAGAGFCSATETRRVVAPMPAEDEELGRGLALAGGRLFVGADRADDAAIDAGAVRIYRRVGAEWAFETTVLAPDPAPGERFGHAVAAAGDRLVVGTPSADGACAGDPDCESGRADVFRLERGAWVHEAGLAPPGGPAVGDRYGIDVAIDGDVAAVGASRAGEGGRVHLFSRRGASWTHEAELVPGPDMAGSKFGGWIDLDGDRIAVAAPTFVPAGGLVGAAVGRVELYVRAGGEWTLEQRLDPPVIHSNLLFGASVDLDGDALIAGAWADPTFGIGAGAAHVFRRDAGAWTLEQSLFASDADSFDNFGNGCALEGGVAVVSAWGDEQPGGTGSGRAYVFAHADGTWSEIAHLSATDAQPFDQLGRPVALTGGRLAMGAIGADVDGAEDAGAVLVYEGVGLDCNDNGTIDLCDVAGGVSPDADGDGVPDECACPADVDDDGSVGFGDLTIVLASWGGCAGPCPADVDGDAVVGLADLLTVLVSWGACP